MLEKLFQLKAHNTNVRTEILAGVTTFLTMAYILFVNPAILGETGMDKGAIFVATCLAAAIGSALMGLVAGWFAFRAGEGVPQDLRLFLATGILGGFTTFSAFALDAVTLWSRGAGALATGYVAVSVAGSILAVAAGLALGRMVLA